MDGSPEPPHARERWEPNEANYKAFVRMRIWSGLLLAAFLPAVGNVIWEFAIPGNERIALISVSIVMFVFLAGGPTPWEMRRLLEWRGKKTISSDDLEYTEQLLGRLVVPVTLLVVVAIFVLLLLDDPIPYAEYIVASAVSLVFLAVGLYAARLKRQRDRSDRL